MNVFTKTSLGIESKVLEYLENGNFAKSNSKSQTFTCWEIEYFSNEDGLLEDPSRFRRMHEEWKELRLDEEELIAKLIKHFFVKGS